MAIIRLMANQVGPWSNTGALGTTTNYANAFTVDVSCWLREINWHRNAAGGTRVPSRLVVWRASDEAIIFDSFTIPDDGAAGWQTYIVPYGVPLEANIEYRVSACFGSGSTVSYMQAARAAAPSPFFWAAAPRRYNGASCNFPATDGGTTYVEAIEIGIDVDNPPPSGGGGGGGGEPLGPWFDTEPGVANKPAHDPGVYPRVIEDLDAGWAPLEANMATVVASVGLAVGANVNTILGRIPQLVATAADLLALDQFIKQWFTGGAPSDWDTTVYNNGVSTVNYLATLATQQNLSRYGLSEFPTGWTAGPVQAFDTELAWSENADLYVVSFTSIPSTTGHGLVAGVDWYPRLGWWSPLNGAQAGPRGFVEFAPQQLFLPGLHRLPGLLLKVKAGTTGEVQAFTRA